jgi:hypothetical protein
MGGAAKFALGLLLIWLSMVCFFFAFHPNGVAGVSNPSDALKWLIGEFNKSSGGSDSSGG